MHRISRLARPLWPLIIAAVVVACDDDSGGSDPTGGAGGSAGADAAMGGGGGTPMGGSGGAPMGGEPMGGEGGVPMGGEPVGGEPVGGEPVGGEPVGGEPMGGEPMGGEPMGGEPMGGEPMGGEPMGGEPMGGEPMGGEPMGGEGGVFEDISEPFDTQRALTLSGADDGQLVWLTDEELRARPVTLSEEGIPEGGETSIVLAALTAEQMVMPLQGAYTGEGQWWALLATGDEGQLQLVNLADASPEARITLDVRPDNHLDMPRAHVAWSPASGQLIVVGRRAPSEDDRPGRPAPVAWQIISVEGIPGELIEDTTGMTLPQAVTPGLGGFVFQWSYGTCAHIPLPEGHVDGSWACGAAPGGALAGEGDALLQVAPAADGVKVFRATPGHLPEDLGALEAAFLDVEGLHPLNAAGGVASLAGTVGERTHVYTAAADEVSSYLPPLNHPLGVMRVADAETPWVSYWAEDAMQIADLGEVTGAAELEPLVLDEGCAGVAPEDCSEADRDCNGAAHNDLCCVQSQGEAPEMEGIISSTADSPPIPSTVVAGAEEPTLLMATEVENFDGEAFVDVVMLTRTGGEAPTVTRSAQWPGASRPTMIKVSPDGDMVLIVAEPEPRGLDDFIVLWGFLEEGEWRTEKYSMPCNTPEPQLGIESPVHDVEFIDGDTARFYCADEIRDVRGNIYRARPHQRPLAHEFTATPYPGERVFRWMSRRRIVRDGAPQWTILTAESTGEDEVDFNLHLWGTDLEAGLVEIPSDEVATLESLFSFEDRRFPIHLPIHEGDTLIRSVGPIGRQVEAWLPGFGWQPIAGSRWTDAAIVSPIDPIMYTMGYLVDPGARFCNRCPVGLFAHDLSAGGDWWGRLMEQDRADELLSFDFQGLGFTHFAPELAEPQLFRLRAVFGEEGPGVRVEGFTPECVAP